MGSVATYVSLFPGEKHDYNQQLIIKCEQNDPDEFFEQFKQGKIKATFFTGNLARDDGQKLYGPGMKEMEFPFEL